MQARECEFALAPVNEGRCTNMRGCLQRSFGLCHEFGFLLITQVEEVFAVVFKLIDRLMHVGQGSVALLLFERAVDIRPPAF